MAENDSGALERVDPETGEVRREAEKIPSVPALRPDAPFPELWKGLGEAPFSPDQAKVILAPVDPRLVLQREDGLLYVPAVEFRRRLHAAFGPGAWGLQPRGSGVMRGVVWWKGALIVLGRVVDEAVGEQKWQPGNARMTYPQAVEAAKTDCLTRCCKTGLGMFSELWDKPWTESWKRGSHGKDGPPPKGDPPAGAGPSPTTSGRTPDDGVSPAQMKAIHAAGSSRGYDHDAIHDYCLSTYGHGLSELTKKEASELIDEIQSWA